MRSAKFFIESTDNIKICVGLDFSKTLSNGSCRRAAHPSERHHDGGAGRLGDAGVPRGRVSRAQDAVLEEPRGAQAGHPGRQVRRGDRPPERRAGQVRDAAHDQQDHRRRRRRLLLPRREPLRQRHPARLRAHPQPTSHHEHHAMLPGAERHVRLHGRLFVLLGHRRRDRQAGVHRRFRQAHEVRVRRLGSSQLLRALRRSSAVSRLVPRRAVGEQQALRAVADEVHHELLPRGAR